jgi:glyoxylase-like metal-dependent hydrolase (beta-lactamase superfamily II)
MLQLKKFTFNPYQENTFLLFDETKQCAIIDPGMNTGAEETAVLNFINTNALNPVLLLNTHCHIDHVLGNNWVSDTYDLKPQFHEGELRLLTAVPSYAPMQGISYNVSPLPEKFLPDTGTITFGTTTLKLLFAPGHSPAHLCFYSEEENFLIGGDVLFRGSIGRTDLPGGNFNQLISSIRNAVFTLPDNCTVYPGHGPETTIGYEKQYNPFLK